MTAVGFAAWTIFSLAFSWLVSRGDRKQDRDFLGLFAFLMVIAVIFVLGKYVWPGVHDPDTDYR